MKILTIVVPSYNVGEYLKQTLESFVVPQIMDKLEVLVVNDGSVDNTATIAEKFVDRYPETFVLINKENGGHGSTVNVGIERANGKYFRIVDGDDWVDKESLFALIKVMENLDVDLILTNYRTDNMTTGEKVDFVYQNDLYDKVLGVDDILSNNLSLPMTSVCYKTSILKNNKIRLQEKIFYVDEEYNILPFAYTNQIYFCNLILYNYRIGNVNQSISIANQIKRIEHKMKVAERLIDFVEDNQFDEKNKEYCYRKLQGLITSIYLIMLIYNPNRAEAKAVVERMQKKLKSTSIELERRTKKKYILFNLLGKMPFRKTIYQTMIAIKRKLGKGKGISYV